MEYSIPFQMYCLTVCLVLLCFFLCLSICLVLSSILQIRYESRGHFSLKDGSDWDAQTRCVDFCTRTGERAWSSRFESTKGIRRTTLPFVRLIISTVTNRYSSHCFEMKGSFSTNRCRMVLNSLGLKYGLQIRNSFEIRSTLG